MICLKSPKSSEFDKTLTNIGQKSFTMFIVSCCNNYLKKKKKIGKLKKKKLCLRQNSNPQSLGLTLRNTCTKKTIK